jgi:hypothetical protein
MDGANPLNRADMITDGTCRRNSGSCGDISRNKDSGIFETLG